MYSPVHPGEILPSGDTHTISVMTSPAPPSALPPRCTRWKSDGSPSAAEYMSMAETTTRFASSRPRSRSGWNIGGRMSPGAMPRRFSWPANQASIRATNSGSRSCRFP